VPGDAVLLLTDQYIDSANNGGASGIEVIINPSLIAIIDSATKQLYNYTYNVSSSINISLYQTNNSSIALFIWLPNIMCVFFYLHN